MKILANVLREPGCCGGMIAGDFNAIASKDDGLVDKSGLVDACVALEGPLGRAGCHYMGFQRGTVVQVGQGCNNGLKG